MLHAYLSIFGATLLAFVAMTAAAETPTPTPTPSGIEGTIFVSPIRPGPVRKDDGPSVAPVSDTRFIVKGGDAAVATFTTDAGGRFRVALPPGHYVVMREGAPLPIGGWRFEAQVHPREMTKVKWTADSGMR